MVEYYVKTRKVGCSVVVTVPKSSNIPEDRMVKVIMEVVDK
jgi:hypothetical protein